ncbi:helix-turn-helix transcriptional regulator [Nocardia aurea]|uniref:helix-turn-helix transcriptional regulator n=1 Tax=Nocardia aurea TaxID=2144174 RepID=UPI001E2CB00E|nr:LuxR family transcriptional regulator [Nocardia aurea]
MSECARIDHLLAENRSGSSGALVLTGEPGIGKTALLCYARERVRDVRVLSVTGVEAETMFPFAALGRLLRPVLDDIASIPDAQAVALRGALTLGEAVPGDRFAVYAATFQLLAAAAEASTILVLVDDAQWLDLSSAEALAFTARRLRAEGLTLLIATRDPQGFADMEMLRVGGFDNVAAAELLTARCAEAPAADVVRVLTEQLEGNPLALSEVADALTPAELTGRAPLHLPLQARLTAERIFGPRIAVLDPGQRLVLEIAAVGAGDGPAAVLAALSTQQIARATVEALEDSGLVSFEAGQVRFVHPLVRTAALADLTPSRLRALHAEMAAVLISPSQAERRAWHLAAAALGQDEDIALTLESAAALASGRGGYDGAATALERAAELSVHDQARARRFYAGAEAARRAGQTEWALRLLTRSEAHACDPALVAAIALTRGQIELLCGRAGVAYTVWQQGAGAVADVDPAMAGSLLAAAAAGAAIAGYGTRALELAQEVSSSSGNDPTITLITKIVTGWASHMLGRSFDQGLEELGSAVELLHSAEFDVDVEWYVLAAFGVAWIGEGAPAQGILDPLVHRLRVEGQLGHLPSALYVSALADSRLGRLESGRAAATEAVDLAANTGDQLIRFRGLGCLALLEAQLGDEHACRTHAAECLKWVELAIPRDMAHDAFDGLGLLELSLGRPEHAISYLAQANRYPEADIEDPVIGRAYSVNLIEAYVYSGRPVPATTIEQLRRFTDAEMLPAAVGSVLWRGRALLADEDQFDTYFTRSLQLHARGGSPFDTARTQLCYGERLRRSGRRRDAREQLEAAYGTFERIGARLWAERAATELTAAGHPIGRPVPQNAGDRLTAQELQVARLAAGGATNREVAAQLFLSVKTIEMHLGRVYRKLGVRSRTQLANLLHNNGLA